MREFIIKFDTDKPLSELTSGTTLRAMMKVTGDCGEIIRCKDCKYWSCDDDESYCSELGICDTDMESYCSYAKRK